jgi:hypothetical protein
MLCDLVENCYFVFSLNINKSSGSGTFSVHRFAFLDPNPLHNPNTSPDPGSKISVVNMNIYVEVESDYAEVKAHYEELKLEVSRLESATADISSSSSDIYETIRPSRQGTETLANGIEERYSTLTIFLFLGFRSVAIRL